MSVDWHARYLQQARWTRPLREYLYGKAGVDSARRVLEVGCGTGALLGELPARTPAAVHGLDLRLPALRQASAHAPGAALVQGDALALPYPACAFEVTQCHYLLLWVRDPLQTLREMRRVTRPGGAVLALAEPDYTRRVDAPAALAPLGGWQTESLRRQGADPGIGARLADLFDGAGIDLVEAGTLGRGEDDPPPPGERALEWAVLESDLAGTVPGEDLRRLKSIDERAWARGERTMYVPTHYAWGRA
jgi:SAM-dependent methyltransferase